MGRIDRRGRPGTRLGRAGHAEIDRLEHLCPPQQRLLQHHQRRQPRVPRNQGLRRSDRPGCTTGQSGHRKPGLWQQHGTSSPPGGPTLPPWNPSGPDGPFSRFSDVVVPASASPSAAVGLAPQEGSAGGSASLATAGQFLGGRPIALADSLDTTEPLPPAGDHACSIRSGDTPTATLTRATDSYFAALADPQFGLAAADLPLVA